MNKTNSENDVKLDNILSKLQTIERKLPDVNMHLIKEKRWLRTHEVAAYLGISDSLVHKLKAEGVITCKKIGGVNLYDRHEVDQIIEQQEVQV